MRTALTLGSILVSLSLGACGVTDSTGAASGAVVVTPSGAIVAATCLGISSRAVGHLITLQEVDPPGQVLVFADGVPLCQDTRAGIGAAGVFSVTAPPGGPGSPSSSDPMPAHGGGDDKSGGGTGGGGGHSTPTGGEGNSDPMPADDTRRN